MNTKPQDVIDLHARLTGQRMRLVPHSVQRQASKFVEHFSLAELEIVLLFTQRQISRNECGYNTQSLTWRVLFGDHGAADEFLKFQERLGMAEEARRRGWKPRLSTGAPSKSAPEPKSAPVAPQTEPDPQEFAATAERLRAFRERLRGPTAELSAP
jgi:hypothetical protein